MHELGVVIEVINQVEKIVAENELEKVEKLILQIGELSSMIPKYIEACYPAAVDGTILMDTKLEIEVLPANALCNDCNQVFPIVKNKGVCPHCNTNNFEILSGKEFFIKEIVAY